MNKHLIALAVLGLTGTAAFAQSSVTVFGVVDANVRSVKTGDVRKSTQDSDGNSSSRFGFRGEEDLGGGNKAGFWLEAPLSPDTGTGNAKLFNRRSTISVMGNSWGEVRLGRDNLTVWNNAAQFDTFGTVGVGTVTALIDKLGADVTDTSRTDNAISYFLPSNLGGIYGQVQYAFGEAAAKDKVNAARLGYKAGAFDAAIATAYINATGGGRWKQMHVGASYDFKVVKLLGQYITDKNTVTDPDRKQKIWELGVHVPVGNGLIKAGYGKSTDYKQATKLAVGYQHNLSKRTALYGTFGQIKNKNAAADFEVKGSPNATAGLLQKSTGYEIGIRHSF